MKDENQNIEYKRSWSDEYLNPGGDRDGGGALCAGYDRYRGSSAPGNAAGAGGRIPDPDGKEGKGTGLRSF